MVADEIEGHFAQNREIVVGIVGAGRIFFEDHTQVPMTTIFNRPMVTDML